MILPTKCTATTKGEHNKDTQSRILHTFRKSFFLVLSTNGQGTMFAKHFI